MFRRSQIASGLLVVGALFAMGCSDAGTAGPRGNDGTDGTDGMNGTDGTDGTDGMNGMDGSNDPTINAITPRKVYLDRKTTVTIGGNDTAWSDMATVDFGAGITSQIVSSSPALLTVDLTIDEGAATGARDVVVTNGAAGAITLKGAFEVSAPLSISAVQGTLAQGSIFVARVRQNDLSTPFDPSSDGDNVSVTSGAGVSMSLDEVQDYTIDFTGKVDVNTAPGEIDIRAVSGLSGEKVSSIAPKAGTVVARMPVALVEGMQSPGSVAMPYESYLYSFAPGAHKLVNIETSAMDSKANPRFVLLPQSGKFDDLVSFDSSGRLLTESNQPIYIIYWDSNGASGYPFDIAISTDTSDDLEPNDTCATAQTLGTGPSALRNLSLRNKTDVDWFAINVTAAEVGKLVHATTKPGDENTDTYVEVFGGTCANLVALGAPSEDKNYHEDHASTAITAAGKVFVKVSNSPTSSFKGTYYDLDVELQKSEAEPNDACAQANAVTTLPADLQFASLSNDSDVDWYNVTVTAADVGKLLEVTTSPGDDNTDTYVEVYSGNCGSTTLLGTSKDTAFHESLQVGPIMTAGVYRVRISNSPTYPYAGSKYNVNFSMALPPDVEPNNTCMQAQQGAALGAELGPMSLSSITDEDWLVYPVSAADIGKSVHVVTAPGDSNTDTVVEVFEGTCAAPVSLGGPSSDFFYHEDWTSSPLTQAGLVYVKVSYSSAGYADAGYVVTVSFE